MKFIQFLIILIFVACSNNSLQKRTLISKEIDYKYDYTVATDTLDYNYFHVNLEIRDLHSENKIFQFAKSIPGSYSISDFGRFLREIHAYDAQGNELKMTRINANQWEINQIENLRRIQYSMDETWDLNKDSNDVSLMSGTSIEKDHILLNTHAVFGYFSHLETVGFRIRLNIPNHFKVGTDLFEFNKTTYFASSFAHLVDSPMLIGKISQVSQKIGNALIHCYVYSKSGYVSALNFKAPIFDVVTAMHKFMEREPVSEYTFLFHCDSINYGALEHKRSSVYVFKDVKPIDENAQMFRDVMAHEFYHLQTPLWIRSTAINQFDFSKINRSEHLWLYEGITEWASHSALMLGELKTINDLLSEYHNKLSYMSRYSDSLSLAHMSMHCYEMEKEYANIYLKGAVIGLLLDLEIMRLTDGKVALRDIMNSLAKKYNLGHAFEEDKIYSEIVSMVHPDLQNFFDRYVKGINPLPLEEYFDRIGLRYFRTRPYSKAYSDLGFTPLFDPKTGKIYIVNVDSRANSMGFMSNDTLLSIDNIKISMNNAREVLDRLDYGSPNVGKPYAAQIKRLDQLLDIKAHTVQLILEHSFESKNLDSINKEEIRKYLRFLSYQPKSKK